MPTGSLVRVYCLGRFRIETDDGASLLERAQSKPLGLLKVLIALGGQHVQQVQVLDALWPEADGDAAQTAFASTLYRLRQLLGQDALLLRNRQLSLNPLLIWSDVHAFESALGETDLDGYGNSAPTADRAERLIALYRGPFLMGESDPVDILSARERLHSRYLRAIRETGMDMERTGSRDAAIELYTKALEVDPCAEELCQRLMVALGGTGRTSEALAVYQRLLRNLGARHAAMPSARTEALRAEMSQLAGYTPAAVADGPKSMTAVADRQAASGAVTVSTDTVSAEASEPKRIGGRRIGASAGRIAAGSVVFAAVFSVFVLWQEEGAKNPSAPPANPRLLTVPDGASIAVLPFTNISNDPGQEYFADGLTDTLITDLSRLHKILVIARNSAFAYKGRAVDLRQVGKELGVRHVLEGSVQASEGRLRINVQLIEAATGTHVWAERYDRPIKDVFLIQDEIASRVVEELDVALVTGEQARTWRRMTRDPVAYSEVLAGRAIQHSDHSINGLVRSRAHFRRAIELDPNFALPWAYMVSVYLHLTDMGYDSEPDVSYESALRHADRAIELNPELPIARAYRGAVLQQLKRYEEADREYKLAVQYGPNAAESLMLSAWGIAAVGNAEEALPLATRALRLDPVPPGWYWGGLADTYLRMQKWEESIPVFKRCLAETVDLIWCRAGLTVAYVRAGQMAQARRSVRDWRRIDPKARAVDSFYLLAWRDPAFRATLSEALIEAGM